MTRKFNYAIALRWVLFCMGMVSVMGAVLLNSLALCIIGAVFISSFIWITYFVMRQL
jgi:hypothetical protein